MFDASGRNFVTRVANLSRPELDRKLCRWGRRLPALVHAPVDSRNLLNETPPVFVFQVQDIRQRPVKMIGDKGYLLEQAFEGVAYDPPGAPPAASTWNWVLQFGQVTGMGFFPPPLLIWR